MPKVLVLAYNAFSDTNANGKTIKSLLSSFNKDEIAQFYCGAERPDWSVTENYFQVTDVMMLKSFYKNMNYTPIKSASAVPESNTNKPSRYVKLRKHNYNFALRFIREILWKFSYRWRKGFKKWVIDFEPDVIFYMVGDSVFMDKLVLSVASKYNIPVVLYNCEAYRIVNLKERKGLEYLYYRRSENSYRKLLSYSKLHVVYNSNYLKNGYESFYQLKPNSSVFYTPYIFENSEYTRMNPSTNFVYFGNMGVGRVDSLVEFAKALQKVDSNYILTVYGSVPKDEVHKFESVKNVKLMGVVTSNELRDIKETADVLVHVESFNPLIMPKLRYAFSTKIAQYLCAGRCVISYAPKDMASSEYLIQSKSVLFASTCFQLDQILNDIRMNPDTLKIYADRALEQARENHNESLIGGKLYTMLNKLIQENL